MNSPVSFLTNLRQDRLQRCEMSFWNKIINALKSSRGNINNSNCTEWSAIWAGIILVISKSKERAALVQFEITRMISDQNCTTHDTRHTTRGSITTLLHQFWNRQNTGRGQFKYFIDAVLSRSEIKFMSILFGEKVRVKKQKFIFLQFDRLL